MVRWKELGSCNQLFLRHISNTTCRKARGRCCLLFFCQSVAPICIIYLQAISRIIILSNGMHKKVSLCQRDCEYPLSFFVFISKNSDPRKDRREYVSNSILCLSVIITGYILLECYDRNRIDRYRPTVWVQTQQSQLTVNVQYDQTQFPQPSVNNALVDNVRMSVPRHSCCYNYDEQRKKDAELIKS